MQKTRSQGHDQPNNPEADPMPCRVQLVIAPGTPVQRQAWACLWRILLMEDIDHNGRRARGIEGETHEM